MSVSSLGDIAGEPMTPRAAVIQMCKRVTCDQSVADYVNRQFGTSMTKRRVAEIRRDHHAPRGRSSSLSPDAEPLPSDMYERRKRAAKSNDRFLKALVG